MTDTTTPVTGQSSAPSTGTTAAIAGHTSPARARAELLIVGVAALAVSLSQSLLVPVLGILPAEFHTSAGNVEWLLTSTLLVGAVAVPLMGRLGDMFGKRRLLLFAVAMLVVGSVISGLTSNIAISIVGRSIQGISLATIPLGISLLSSLLPKERVPGAIALISAMLGVGGALGVPLAGVVGQNFDFHWLFWITAAVGLTAFVAALLVVPESPNRSGGRVDFVGALLLSAALVCLLLPVAEGGKWGWGSPAVIGLLAASVLLLVVFAWTQLRIREPLVDMRTLRRPPIVMTNICSVLFGFALFASLIGTATYVQAPEASGYGFGASIVVSGFALLPGGLGMLLFSPVAARLIVGWGANRTLSLGAFVVAVGWLMRITVTGSLTEVIIGTSVISIGTGIGYSALPALINANTPARELASANGLNSLARTLGSSLASAIGGAILAASTIRLGDFALPSLGAFQALFALCGGAAVIAAVLALFIPAPAPEE